MPNVILESFTCQTPVVSFNCLSGPAAMISDRKMDFGENQILKLTEAMNEMVTDDSLYRYCKQHRKY
jgi:N-acetylgalactosamine-N,N'-diacetylbacillosaminyl-diphospho-undecaprenol 4-alpha-N-acetylgalactosaminyltransferase